jgi:hypothetical protein
MRTTQRTRWHRYTLFLTLLFVLVWSGCSPLPKAGPTDSARASAGDTPGMTAAAPQAATVTPKNAAATPQIATASPKEKATLGVPKGKASLANLVAPNGKPYEFTCDIASTTIDDAGKTQKTAHKLAIKGNKVRTETVMEDGTLVWIVDADKKVSWMFGAGETTALQQPYAAGEMQASAGVGFLQTAQDVARTSKPTGTDMVDGKACSLFTMPVGRMCIWVEQGIPLRIEMKVAGSATEEWTNIKLGNVPDSLFEPPAGAAEPTGTSGATPAAAATATLQATLEEPTAEPTATLQPEATAPAEPTLEPEATAEPEPTEEPAE